MSFSLRLNSSRANAAWSPAGPMKSS
jgi:hypothetical protein